MNLNIDLAQEATVSRVKFNLNEATLSLPLIGSGMYPGTGWIRKCQNGWMASGNPTGAGILHEKDVLMDAPHKPVLLAHFHVGDLAISLRKVPLVACDVLLYTGLHGTMGILVPFVCLTHLTDSDPSTVSWL